ncbi:cytochrome p450 protein [Rutstroemia sp. NJR-2017a WRK4]|nr:cytochrome p450 protein [Rutstroemia sp. NJR-2017a WRK4]
MAVLLYIGILALLSLAVWTIYGVIYRLYLSPIAKFPGPKLAALTLWYEFYYNIVLNGQYVFEIKKMHEKYEQLRLPGADELFQGPIVRINPWELHIDDLDYYDELYAGSGKKREKYPWFVAGGGSPGSVFETIPHDLHRLRRSAINHFFSNRSITAIEPMIKAKVSQLSDIFHAHMISKKPVNLRVAFSALTLDIISDYCYGESFGALKNEKLAMEWYYMLEAVMAKAPLFMHFPWLLKVMSLLPDSIAGPVLRHHRNSRNKVGRVLRYEDTDSARQDTVFHTIRDSDLPPEEKKLNRLADEGNILIGAGSETTAQTLAVLFFYLLENPEMITRLRDEISGVEGDITWGKLEKLPFLSGCVTEALRIGSVAAIRLPRTSPTEDLKFKKWTIPAGTPTSMTNIYIHHSPVVFPSPLKFDPTRWMQSKSDPEHGLEKYFLPFSKGSRACVGMNLAYAELYLTTALLIKRFDFQLFETTARDVKIHRVNFVTEMAPDSKGVRVRVLGDREG